MNYLHQEHCFVYIRFIRTVLKLSIGVARILSGVHFFLPKKVDDLFLVVALKDRLNIPPSTPNLTRLAKTHKK